MSQVLPEFSYFDIIISDVNNEQITPQPIYYSQSRNLPYLYQPDKYNLSVLRWTADTSTLPIFRCQIKPNSTSAVDSIYSITLVYNGTPAQVFLQYSSQQINLEIPAPPSDTISGLQDNSTLYYDVYSYQFVIMLINQTFQAAFEKLVELTGLSTTVYAPFFTFDTNLNIAILNAAVDGYNLNTNGIQIFFNPALANLFSTFPYYLVNQISTTGQNYQVAVNVFNQAGTTIYSFVDNTGTVVSYNIYQIFQESSTITALNPVVAIVMCSNSLPVLPTNVAGTFLYSKPGSSINPSGNNAQTNNVITDFVSDTGLYRSNIVYTPSAEYRRLTLNAGTDALTNLDISLYWRDRLGGLNPLLLASGSTVTIKLLFELKIKNY